MAVICINCHLSSGQDRDWMGRRGRPNNQHTLEYMPNAQTNPAGFTVVALHMGCFKYKSHTGNSSRVMSMARVYA